MNGDEPLPNVTVAAYATLDFAREPIAVALPSDQDGSYRLELPEGTYALFGWNEDRSRFAFYGRNPLNVNADPVWAGMQVVPVETPVRHSYSDAYTAAVEGYALYQGQALSMATVYLYLDVAEDLKGQGYRLSLPTAEDGYFRFDGLPESDYFLVLRQRQSGQRVGPVAPGDLIGVFPGNPLTAKAGEVVSVRLHGVEKLKESKEAETFGRVNGPVLRGVVVDASGEAVAGVHVFAYVDRVIGHQRPAALSAPTSADGRFLVNLPEPGTYYVGARQAYGDSPAPGELFGMYEVSADHGLTVEAGESFENIRIVVEPIDIF